MAIEKKKWNHSDNSLFAPDFNEKFSGKKLLILNIATDFQYLIFLTQ